MTRPTLGRDAAQGAEAPGLRRAGTSDMHVPGGPFRRYLLLYGVAVLGCFMAMAAMSNILLPNQVQGIEFGNFFRGADAGLDLKALTDLNARVADGALTPTAEQTRQLAMLRAYDAARAESLSIAAALGILATLVVQPIVGALSDRTRSRFGRRAPWILAGTIVGALAIVGLRYSSTIPLVIAFSAVASVTINVALGPLNTTVADRVPHDRRGVASAIQGLGLLLGAAIGAIIAAVLFASIGLDAYFPLAIVVAVLGILFVLLARDRSSKQLELEPLHWGPFLRGFIEPLRAHDFRWTWIARATLMFGYSISTVFSLYMLQSYVQPALSAAVATATAPLLAVVLVPAALIGIVICGPLSDRLRRRKPFVIWSSVLMAASYVIPLAWPTVTAMILQMLIGGLAFGIFIAVDAALFLDVLPNKLAVGRDLGVAAVATNLGQAIAPLVAGQIVAISGSYALVWVASIIVVLIAAVAIVPVRSVR
ncbi:MFS family permease [Microbacterium sp. W4I4]|uniref:MFS transporter n=1 Tax=Microbacterium sp. W4I4 TaxID=3042295 RepID=UPI002785217C|nr:MFS transporter [Microbacterium sp. W4I4]MDQ0614000.1 MFS family permease [Microbacterium sp. W4I4]